MNGSISNQDFYAALDVLCKRLRGLGMVDEADRLSFRLHKVAWTSSSELFEEIALQLQGIIEGPNASLLDRETRHEFETRLAMLVNK